MIRKSWFGFVVVALLLAAYQPSAAAGNTPSDFIRSMGEQAIMVLREPGTTIDQREQRFRGLLSTGFDMNFIGRFVLGSYWARAAPEQRDDYLALFNDYVLRNYSTRFGGYAGEVLTVVGERPAGKKDVLVRTKIDRPSGPPIRADWRIRVINGQYKIIDVMVEGISMVLTQKQEFATVIKNNGLDGLIEILRARTNKLGATASAR